MHRIRIATRRSRLALVQAQSVADALRRSAPELQAELVGITTRGDRDRSPTLAAAGGKDSFVKALEEALADHRADIAVHSMKDVGVAQHEAFALAPFGARADVRDALVTRGGGASLAELPPGARIGTSSLRRRAFVAALRRDCETVPLRGNVDTRLERLDAGACDALLLACAGLDRLGRGARIDQRIDPRALLPAPCQGALAVQCLAERGDVRDLIRTGVRQDTARCIAAERALTRALGADCAMPLGALCTPEEPAGRRLRLRAVVADAGGERVLRAEAAGDAPEALAARVAERLAALGAERLLA